MVYECGFCERKLVMDHEVNESEQKRIALLSNIKELDTEQEDSEASHRTESVAEEQRI